MHSSRVHLMVTPEEVMAHHFLKDKYNKIQGYESGSDSHSSQPDG